MNDFDKDMAHVHDLRKMAAQCEQEAKEILSKYTWDEERAYPAGQFIVDVAKTRRFDAGWARKNLSEEDYALTLVTKPDSMTAKKNLPPEKYALAQRDDYGWTVKVRPANEV